MPFDFDENTASLEASDNATLPEKVTQQSWEDDRCFLPGQPGHYNYIAVQDRALALWNLGANVTAIASTKGGQPNKGPIYKWKEQPPYPRRQGRPNVENLMHFHVEGRHHPKYGEIGPATRIGIIHGPEGCGGWRCFDLDAIEQPDETKVPIDEQVVLRACRAAGIPDDYVWRGRSGSGAGWHVWFRSHVEHIPVELFSEKPGEKGVYKELALHPKEFDHLELRWEGVQSVCYIHPVPAEPPMEIGLEQIIAFWQALTRPPGSKVSEPALRPAQATVAAPGGTPAYQGERDRSAIEEIKARITTLDVARALFSGEEQYEGDRVRILGNHGLIVDPNGGFVIYGENIQGDQLDLIGYHLFGQGYARDDKEQFKRVLTQAASMAGVELPKRGAGRRLLADRTTEEAATVPDELLFGAGPLPFLPPGLVLDMCERGDFGNATLFRTLYEGRAVFDVAFQRWFVWGGNSWTYDERGVLSQAIPQILAPAYRAEAVALSAEIEVLAGDDDEASKAELQRLTWLRDCCNKQAGRCDSTTGIKSAMAQAMVMLSYAGAWDANPWLLGCPNGVIDLRTGSFRAGRPDDYIRTPVATAWRGLDVRAPRWEQTILQNAGDDPELAAFKQRLFGHALIGSQPQQVLALMIGTGSNGKDLEVGALTDVLGSVTTVVRSSLLVGIGDTNPDAPSPGVHSLYGKRLAFSSETKEGADLDVAGVKELTGGGRLCARAPYGQNFTFDPTHTLFLRTNNAPSMPSGDQAIWNRVHVINYPTAFVDDPDPTNRRQRRKNPRLRQELADEASGILAWLVRGCLDYIQRGERLDPPETSRVLAKRMRQANDPVEAFVKERCALEPDARQAAGALLAGYENWCLARKIPFNRNALGEKLRSEDYMQRGVKVTRCSGRVHYSGIRLLKMGEFNDDDDDQGEDARGYGDTLGDTLGDTPKPVLEHQEAIRGHGDTHVLAHAHVSDASAHALYVPNASDNHRSISKLSGEVSPYHLSPRNTASGSGKTEIGGITLGITLNKSSTHQNGGPPPPAPAPLDGSLAGSSPVGEPTTAPAPLDDVMAAARATGLMADGGYLTAPGTTLDEQRRAARAFEAAATGDAALSRILESLPPALKDTIGPLCEITNRAYRSALHRIPATELFDLPAAPLRLPFASPAGRVVYIEQGGRRGWLAWGASVQTPEGHMCRFHGVYDWPAAANEAARHPLLEEAVGSD